MVLTTTQLNSIKTAAIAQINSDMTHIAVSTNSNTPTVSDTSLGGTELMETIFSSSTTATSINKSIFLDVTEFNSNTILKAGAYSALSGGNLLSTALTNSIPKTALKEVFVEVQTDVSVVNG